MTVAIKIIVATMAKRRIFVVDITRVVVHMDLGVSSNIAVPYQTVVNLVTEHTIVGKIKASILRIETN